MTARTILYLSRADIEALDIAPLALVAAVEQQFRALHGARAQSPPKVTLLPGEGRLHQAAIAASAEPAYFSVKSVGLSPANHARGLPHIGALLTLHDALSGMPVAVMDATWLTGMRTAAMSAAAARRLARADSSTIGFVACGVQARAHLAVFRTLFPLARVVAYARRHDSAAEFVRDAAAQGLAATVAAAPEDAVRALDMVVTSVPDNTGQRPALDPDLLAPGGFAALVDGGRSWIADRLARFDVLATDDRAQSEILGRSGRLPVTGPFAADLGELVSGTRPGRTTPGQRTAFLFPGTALGDLAAAVLIFERAQALGRGTALPA